MIEDIKNIANDLITALEVIEKTGVKKYFFQDFDCSSLKDWNTEDIRDSKEYKDVFKEFVTISGPVIYWFEIISETSSETIRRHISEYKDSEGAKSVPALKKTYLKTSNALYVGKVKRNFWGRVIQHLGYYKVKRTQGLQLYYWAKEIGLKVRLHAYEFEPNMEDLVSVFELKFARQLKPITGKHS